MFKLKSSIVAIALIGTAFCMSAQAETIYGTSFGTGSSYATTLNGVAATFSATSGGSPGNFSYKSQAGYTGVGVEGGGTLEIDIDQSIAASFGAPINISGFTIALLFDGPEYGDVNETAEIRAVFSDNTVHTFTFSATGSTTGSWSGGGTFSNLSTATDGSGAVWNFTNPFEGAAITSLSFTAIQGSCGSGACTNQSDFTLISVSAVPEPGSYAMMLAGLGLMGFVVSRRRS